MALIFLALAVAAGSLIPLQAGMNASLRHYLPHPVLAALTNFIVGFSILGLASIALRAPLPSAAQIAKTPWWCWFGGSMGACLVLAGVFLSHRLGATTFFACIMLGQVAASLICDHYGLAGYPVHPLNWQRVAGVLLLGAGMWTVRTS